MTQCAQGPLCVQYIPIADNIFTPSNEVPTVSQRVVKPTLILGVIQLILIVLIIILVIAALDLSAYRCILLQNTRQNIKLCKLN